MRKYLIRDLFEIIGGKPSPQGENCFSKYGTPFVKMKDLGKVHFSNNFNEFENYVSEEVAQINRLTSIKKGAILLPRSGSVALNHRAVLGVDAYIVSHICALQVKDPRVVYNIYAYYYLRSINMVNITKKTTGLDAITFEDLGKIKIPLPSLDDQIRIASLLSKVENLISRRREQLKQLDELLKSVFLEMFGDPVSNEKGWEMKRVDEISDSRLGKMRDKKFITGNHLRKYIGNSNVQWFRFKLDNLEEMDFDERERALFGLLDGDLLICEGGDIGRCAIWRNNIAECYFQKAIHRVRLYQSQAIPEYVQYVMMFFSLYNGFKNVTCKATIAHLTGEKLKETLIPLPPLELQNHFSKIVEKIEGIKSRYQQSLTALENLYGILSQKAFKGELDLSRVQVVEEGESVNTINSIMCN